MEIYLISFVFLKVSSIFQLFLSSSSIRPENRRKQHFKDLWKQVKKNFHCVPLPNVTQKANKPILFNKGNSKWVLIVVFLWNMLNRADSSRVSYILAESLAVVSTGEVKVSIQVKVIWRELSHSKDCFLTLFFNWVNIIHLLRLPHQRLLQTCDHLALGVNVLWRDSSYC